jgi:hypothetical protein
LRFWRLKTSPPGAPHPLLRRLSAFGILANAPYQSLHPQGALEKQYRLSLLQVLQCDSEEPCE